MDQQIYVIKFDGISPADTNHYADELRNTALYATADVEVQRRRDNPNTQDFGTTLVLVIGAPAVTVIARAVENWLKLVILPPLCLRLLMEKLLFKISLVKNAAELAQILLTTK